MFEGFVHSQRIHFPAMLVCPILDGRFQEMSRCLDRQRIGNSASGALFVLSPGWMRQRDPHWTSAGQKLDVNGISVTGRDGDDQGLVNAVQPLPGPAIYGVEVLIHCY